jgi:hypothetical protein
VFKKQEFRSCRSQEFTSCPGRRHKEFGQSIFDSSRLSDIGSLRPFPPELLQLLLLSGRYGKRESISARPAPSATPVTPELLTPRATPVAQERAPCRRHSRTTRVHRPARGSWQFQRLEGSEPRLG